MSASQAYLTDLQGQVIARLSPKDLVTFGQADGNTIVLDDVSVSSQHGAISYRAGQFTIERWSRGRVWVNGTDNPVEGSLLLQDGDRVHIGKRHVFVFRLGVPEGDEVPDAYAAPTSSLAAAGAVGDEAPVEDGVEAAPDESAEAEGDNGLPAWQESPAPVGETVVDAPEDAPTLVEGEAGDETLDETSRAPVDLTPVDIAPVDITPAREDVEALEPPVQVPSWVTAEDSARDPEYHTPPDGLDVMPGSWQQEVRTVPESAPVAPPPATAVGDGVFGARERSEARRLIQDAVQVLRYGDTERARQKLNQALRLNESNEDAWLWLAAAERDPERRRGALQRVLTINPNNETAQWGLVSLQTLSPASWQPPAQSAEPGRSPGFAAARPTQPLSAAPPVPHDSIPAMLLRNETRTNPGIAWLARLMTLVSIALLGVAMFLDYGLWDLEDIHFWNDVPAAGVVWRGLEVWGFAGIVTVIVLGVIFLLIRSKHQRWLGMLLTTIGLAVIFMGLLPPVFGLVKDPEIGVVVWAAAGLPLMLGGLLKFW
jgi:predicted component of type VI protein secretion system